MCDSNIVITKDIVQWGIMPARMRPKTLDEYVGQITVPAEFKVHEQKRNVSPNIDSAEVVIILTIKIV